eukprot:m.5215 g.5215  ORF g.5215 m.5215 type:complete len:524 (+) comp3253_c0_seq1:232-1803(+)
MLRKLISHQQKGSGQYPPNKAAKKSGPAFWQILCLSLLVFSIILTRFALDILKNYDLALENPKINPPNCECITMREVIEFECKNDMYSAYQEEMERIKEENRLCVEMDPVISMPGSIPPLIVMITTVGHFKQGEKDPKYILQRGAASTLAVLRPTVLTILDLELPDSLMPDPTMPRVHCPSNDQGTPRLKSLFGHAEMVARRLRSPWAGFINADIAVDTSLTRVLEAITHETSDDDAVLVIGQRLNMHNASSHAEALHKIRLDTSRSLASLRSAMKLALVGMSRNKENRWMGETAMDYFFFKPGTFDWDDIPEFMVGRIGWDSWIVQWAIDHGVKVIDSTPRIHAAHLTGTDGNIAGWGTPKKDKFWNYCSVRNKCEKPNWFPMVLKKDKIRHENWQSFCDACFRCKLGSTTQAPYYIDFSQKRRLLEIKERQSKNEEKFSEDHIGGVRRILEAKGYYKEATENLLGTVRDEPNCHQKRSCCSLYGMWAVNCELEKQLQIRGRKPGRHGYDCQKNMSNIRFGS